MVEKVLYQIFVGIETGAQLILVVEKVLYQIFVGVETGAQLILVVEKDTVFQRLIQEYLKQDSLRQTW